MLPTGLSPVHTSNNVERVLRWNFVLSTDFDNVASTLLLMWTGLYVLPTLKQDTGFPYSLPSVGPGAHPGVQAVSPQATISHPPGVRLPLLSARPAVTFPAAEHHRPLAGTKLYCLVTEAHRCEQLVATQLLPRVGFERTTCWSQVQRSTRCTIPHHVTDVTVFFNVAPANQQ